MTAAGPRHPSRRRLLGGTVAVLAAPMFVARARAADAQRFGLGVASGQPTADGVVLWTLVTGPDLPPAMTVGWELADDEAFRSIVARGEEAAAADDAWSVHAEPRGLAPDRWFFYRFTALGQRSPVGRTRTAPAAGAPAGLEFAIASCQRYDVGHYAAWRHMAAEGLDLVMFLGDYIYEYPSGKASVRPVEGRGLVRTLAQYRARYATYKSDPDLQAAHAAAPWLVVWDDHEVGNDYANLRGEHLEPDFRAQRAAAYRAWWEHMPFPKSARPIDADARIHGRLDWGRLARIHLVDDRQYRDPQVCTKPGRGGSNTVPLRDCPALLDPARTLLGADQEQWLAEGWDARRPWNLLAQQTLMARSSWSDPAIDGGTYWTDGWDGYPAARARLLAGLADRGIDGAVVLGGDVHAHYVADLRRDADDTGSPIVASEFCGSSITSLGLPQPQLDAARAWNPHLKYARADQRGYMRFSLDERQLRASLRVVDDARDPASGIATVARFVVEAGRPGPVAA